MRVRCISERPSEQQAMEIGCRLPDNEWYPITAGKEYVVLGLHLLVGTSAYGKGVFVEVPGDHGYIGFAPLCLFEITDAHASRFWEVRIGEEGSVSMLPRSLFEPSYNEDLSENVPGVVADFERVVRLLESEWAG